MVSLLDLWLPILLSAVFVFLASSVIHMALPIHKSDYKKIPGEDAVLEAMRKHSIAPGGYMFPSANSMKEMCTPEMVEKMKRGPVGNMTVIESGVFNMGKNLTQWFIFCLVVGVFVAYVASLTVPAGAAAMLVFRATAAASFLAYGLSSATNSIWKGVSWGITLKFVFDGLVYALATGAAFAWMWPKGM